jgi:negative regulator of flagellin synthesis FlgM
MSVNNVNNAGATKAQLENVKLAAAQEQTKAQQLQKANAAAPQSKTDSVSLSASAQQMNASVKDAPVDQAKLDRLKRAIVSGEYKVDPEKLARNIAKFEQDLFE